MIQEVPRCFMCTEPVEHDPVFEAPCGHEDAASGVFHPLCLMKWRENRDLAVKRAREYADQLRQQHEGEH